MGTSISKPSLAYCTLYVRVRPINSMSTLLATGDAHEAVLNAGKELLCARRHRRRRRNFQQPLRSSAIITFVRSFVRLHTLHSPLKLHTAAAGA